MVSSAFQRALLDQGSTHKFISKRLANALNSKTYLVSAEVSGLPNQSINRVSRLIPINVKVTRCNDTVLSIEALILDSLTSYLPQFSFRLSNWEHLRGLILADERPTDNTPIHAIIGVDLCPYALRDGICEGRPGKPVAQNIRSLIKLYVNSGK